MPEPLARHEDRAADVEAEGVVLERRAVPVAHQEADQALVRLVHLRLAPGEARRGRRSRPRGRRPSRRRGARSRGRGPGSCRRGSLRSRSRARDPSSASRTETIRAMAIKIGTSGWSYPSWRPGFYPDGLQPAEFLALLRRALRHGRAELDRLPAAERRPVPPLGGRRAGRVRVRGQVLARPARPRHDVPRARARARRPARAGARRLRGAARRRDALVRRGLGAGRGAARLGLPRRVVGGRRRRRARQRPRARSRSATSGCASRRTPTTSCARSQRRSATRPTSTSATRTSRPRRRSPSVCALSYSRRVWIVRELVRLIVRIVVAVAIAVGDRGIRALVSAGSFH